MVSEQQLVDALEHEVDFNLARYTGPREEPRRFSIDLPVLQLTPAMRQTLVERYEAAGWRRACLEDAGDNELLFVLDPPTEQYPDPPLDGSWFGRLGPPPPLLQSWYDWMHQAAIPLLWIAVLCLWILARWYSAQVPG